MCCYSRDGKGFGKGNLGYEGMLKFFQSHRCNSICKFLNLPAHQPKQPDKPSVPLDLPPNAEGERKRGDSNNEPHKFGNPTSSHPIDFKLLGLSSDQFEFIAKHFNACVKEGSEQVGRRGLMNLCGKLGAEITIEEATQIVKTLDKEETGTIDLSQFLWWWCGIEEAA